MDRTIGDWQKISNLGAGGFGVVSLWMNRDSRETIAIKRCKKHEVSDKERERWCREVEIVKSTRHPNIISYKVLPAELETGIKSLSDLPLLSMEYCSGGNLRFVLQRSCNSSGLQEADVRTILGDTTEALLYLHQLNIVHRDFKPENIVLQKSTERKGGLTYKLIDLGFAKKLDSMLSIVGTTAYVAPEIICGRRYNVAVDYWSFGIVAYEIICGNEKYPFPADVPLVERMDYLKTKKHNHISVNKSLTGVSYSSRINQKCHLSSWLKEEIEKWLQMPLELDGTKRGSPNPLLELKLLLERKVLTVFSMYTLQFYYYEINECILISTLKTWIHRDTKMETSDQLLLVGKISSLPSDDDLLINVLPETDTTVYVFNKCFLWSPIAKLTSPDFLTDEMDTMDKSTALSSTIYCVVNEIQHFSAVANSISLLNDHTKLLFRETFTQHERLYLTFYKMVTLLEFFNSIRKEISIKRGSCNSFEKQTEQNFLYLKSCMNNIRTKIDKLEVRLAQLKRCEQIIINEKSKTLNAVLAHHLAELERQISGVEAKIKSTDKSDKSHVKMIVFNTVSEIIRKRQEKLRYLKSEAKIQDFVMEEVPKIKDWMCALEENINQTISSLHTLQSQGYELAFKEADLTTEKVKSENGVLDYKKLIKDNKYTRLQLEEAIITGLNRFRMQCEVTENFVHSILPKC